MTMETTDLASRKILSESLKEMVETYIKESHKNSPIQYNAAFEDYLLVLVNTEAERVYKNWVLASSYETINTKTSVSTVSIDCGCHSNFSQSQNEEALPQKLNLSQENPLHNDTLDQIAGLSSTCVSEVAAECASNLRGNDAIPIVDLTKTPPQIAGIETEDKVEPNPRETVSNPTDMRKTQTKVNASSKKKPKLASTSNHHKCGNCDFSTSQKGRLTNHVLKCFPFKCEICDCSFRTKEEFQQHMAMHGVL